jgi:isopentenyl-diphosphate Delta-isomerase
MEEKLLIVDEKDNIIATETREKCHSGDGILHRAITSFVFNDKGQLLITQRSNLKKLWPGSWDTSCSTHVYENETYEKAGERRLPQELGFSCKLKFLLKFQYQVKYKDIGSENEVCALLIGKYNGQITPNPQEVMDYKWIPADKLEEAISKNPEKYTPWLKIALKEYLKKEIKV